MKKEDAIKIIKSVFGQDFNEPSFISFVANIFKQYTPDEKIREQQYIKDAFKEFVLRYKIIGHFTDSEGKKIDILEVFLNKDTSLDRARTAQRNFVADYLKTNNSDAALVAFISPQNKDWRLSLVKLEQSLEIVDDKLKSKQEITPAKRWSFLVGQNEGNHTAQSRFVQILTSDEDPNLAELESAFDIETVTKEFFRKYTDLFFRLKEELDGLIEKDLNIKNDFVDNEISTVDFAKKTLGQIVFLYFLQKKGWFGVAPDKKWGDGPKQFIRELFNRREKYGTNFFNDILEPLFYKALAQDRGKESIYPDLNNCRMPFLNGGLFEPMNDYKWETTNIVIPDNIFSNNNKTKEGDIGDGILDVFDRYNFTVNENEPLEKEVAVDPEMLGKVFENLLDIKDRKSKGAFYTPREIVHYMCKECLINYLDTENNADIPRENIELFIQKGDHIIENDRITVEKIKEKEEKGYQYKGEYKFLCPDSIISNAELLDELLENIKVADPAVGSGAFPLGMINEIVRARKVLNIYFGEEITDYELKLYTISNSIYGVDIDPGAVEIAKLRLWLSLVVDEDTPHPLPNLDHKIMQGNSLISEYEGIKLFDETIFDKEKAKGIEQMNLRLGKSASENKMEELQNITEKYIHESQRTKKQELKQKIDELKWELIEMTLREQKKEEKLTEIKESRKKNVKPFFIWKLEFSDVFKEKGGFDVVIGNPPYVGESGNKNIFRPIAKGNLGKFYQGKMDLFYFFFHLALDLGKNNAECAFITTNYFLTAFGAKKMRADLKERSIINNLINFNELKIFESALGQHNMITVFSKGQSSEKLAHTAFTKRNGVANEKILSEIVKNLDKSTEYNQIPQKELYDGAEAYIRLNGTNNQGDPIQKILNKVQKESDTLDSVCNVNQGVVSGCDYVSGRNIEKLEDKTGIEKNDGIFVFDLNNQRDLETLDTFNEDEKKLLRPFFKNSDINRYYSQSEPSKYLLYYENHLDEEKYPNIANHLRKFYGILNSRLITYGETYHWTALHRAREEKIFLDEKIVVPYRSTTNTFAINNQEWFCRSDCYVITEKTNECDLKFILGILNSKPYFQWLYHRGKRKGETLELFQAPLSEIPIKKISTEAQKPFIDLVDQILEITSAPDYDPKKPPVKQKELEKQIDELVYNLYDLGPKEIKIVEKNI